MGSEQDTDLLPADSMLWPINTRRQPMSQGVPFVPARQELVPVQGYSTKGDFDSRLLFIAYVAGRHR